MNRGRHEKASSGTAMTYREQVSPKKRPGTKKAGVEGMVGKWREDRR